MSAVAWGTASPADLSSHLPGIPDFERLLGSEAWARLPAAVRARFDAAAHAAAPTVYRGTACVQASLLGQAFAHLCRCIGTPVTPYVGDAVPMTVRVYRARDGIVWERAYEFARGTSIVKSTKQVVDGVLVEKLGAGLHMQLRVYESAGALYFASAGYFFRVGAWRVNLPDWFLPGATHVAHIDLGVGQFRFTLRTQHRWLGKLYDQDGVFSQSAVVTPRGSPANDATA
jgi:hypothetical protein